MKSAVYTYKYLLLLPTCCSALSDALIWKWADIAHCTDGEIWPCRVIRCVYNGYIRRRMEPAGCIT